MLLMAPDAGRLTLTFIAETCYPAVRRRERRASSALPGLLRRRTARHGRHTETPSRASHSRRRRRGRPSHLGASQLAAAAIAALLPASSGHVSRRPYRLPSPASRPRAVDKRRLSPGGVPRASVPAVIARRPPETAQHATRKVAANFLLL